MYTENFATNTIIILILQNFKNIYIVNKIFSHISIFIFIYNRIFIYNTSYAYEFINTIKLLKKPKKHRHYK